MGAGLGPVWLPHYLASVFLVGTIFFSHNNTTRTVFLVNSAKFHQAERALVFWPEEQGHSRHVLCETAYAHSVRHVT